MLAGKQHWLCRAVDEHGPALDITPAGAPRNDWRRAVFPKPFRHLDVTPERNRTGKLGSYEGPDRLGWTRAAHPATVVASKARPSGL